MDTVLKELNLGGVTEKFEAEQITPDLVCKLSIHEMEISGINFHSDMMSLRIVKISVKISVTSRAL